MTEKTAPAGPEHLTRTLVLLLAAACAVRTVVACSTYVIGTDSRQFLLMTEHLYRGEFGRALDLIYHPLYPMVSALFYTGFPGVEASAMAVSVCFGSLTILPLFFFTRDCWGTRPAILTCLIYAFLPSCVEVESDIMTEGLFIFLFFTAVAVFWHALKSHRPSHFAATALAAALALWTRPEGIYLVVLVVLWSGVEMIRQYRATRKPPFVLMGGLLLFLFLMSLLYFPYVLWVREKTGRFWFTTKGSATLVEKALKGEAPQEVEHERRREEWKQWYGTFLGSVLYFAVAVLKAAAWIPPLFFVLCVFFISRIPATRHAIAFSASIVLIYFVPAFIRLLVGEALSTRYVLLGMMFLMPLAMIGFTEVFHWCWQRYFPKAGDKAKKAVFASVLVLGLFGMSTQTIEKRRYREVPLREAGEWMRPQLREGEVVMSSREKIAWYARAEFVSIPRTFDNLLPSIDRRRIRYISIVEDDLQDNKKVEPEFRERCDQRLGPPRIFAGPPGERMKRVLVYTVY